MRKKKSKSKAKAQAVPGRIQWHPGLCAGFELEFKDYDVSFEREHKLTRAPLSIDLLIIHKLSDQIIGNDIGRFFRRYNIIEFKSPEDSLSIDTFYKVQAYACLYKSQGEKTDSIPADSITVTLYRDTVPVALIASLREAGSDVVPVAPGIYEIRGSCLFPTQIVISHELDPKLHSALRIMSKDARREDVEEFAKLTADFRNQADMDRADSVLQVSISANRALYRRIYKEDTAMCEALLEIMKDDIDRIVQERYDKEIKNSLKDGIRQGEQKLLRDLVKDGILTISDAARRAGMTVEEFTSQTGLK